MPASETSGPQRCGGGQALGEEQRDGGTPQGSEKSQPCSQGIPRFGDTHCDSR